MTYLSDFLLRIKELVKALGEDPLEDYSRHGFLERDVVDMVKGVGKD